MANPDYGVAWSCLTDLTMPAVMVTGFRVVAESIARRWQTPRGGLIDDPNYGYDLSGLISDKLNVKRLSEIASQASAEAEKDERVGSCDVEATFVGGMLMIAASVTLADSERSFTMVVSVDNLSVSLLKVSD